MLTISYQTYSGVLRRTNDICNTLRNVPSKNRIPSQIKVHATPPYSSAIVRSSPCFLFCEEQTRSDGGVAFSSALFLFDCDRRGRLGFALPFSAAVDVVGRRLSELVSMSGRDASASSVEARGDSGKVIVVRWDEGMMSRPYFTTFVAFINKRNGCA